MLLFLGESLFNLTTPAECEDRGIVQIRELQEDAPASALWLFTWTLAGLAAGNVDYLLQRAWAKGLPSLRLVDGISPLVFASWVFFTFASLLSLLILGRMGASYGFKFVHVALELSNLSLFLLQARWFGSALITLSLALFGVLATLTMPCTVAFRLTGLGAVLDSANFGVCAALVLLGVRTSPAFRLATWAFFWHATYIWAFLLMSYATDESGWVIALRLYGVLANALSVHVGVSAVDRWWRDEDDAEDAYGGAFAHTDSALLSSPDPYYTLASPGVSVANALPGYLLLGSAALAPGAAWVAERRGGSREGQKTLYGVYGAIAPLRREENDNVLRVTNRVSRALKIVGWIVFVDLIALLAPLSELWAALVFAPVLTSVLAAWLAQAAAWLAAR